MGMIHHLSMSRTSNGGFFNDTIVYSSINNSGRLIIWELSTNPLSDAALEAKNKEINIYPNPTSNEINFQFTEIPNKTYTISILNTMGKQVYFEQVNNFGTNHKIQTELASGVYFVNISVDGKMTTKKIVIHKSGKY